MDTPQRANAAQMAARSLKAKPRGRLQNGRSSSAMGARPDSIPQFAPMPQNGGGNLFGGSVQGASTFNFSAPGGLTIPTPSFGSFGSNTTPSPDVSDSERFPGDDRATKRQFGGSTTIQPSPTFPPTGAFGQSQANPFGGVSQPAPGGGIFSFGGTPAAPPTNFNPGNAPPVSSPFSFGGSTAAAPVAPGINFGSNTTENKPTNNPFTFGQQPAQSSVPSSPFTFGATATQEKPPVSQPQASSGIFNFGSTATPAKPTQHAPASNTPFQFGATATQEKPAVTPFSFDSNKVTATSSSINFGSTVSTAAPTSNLFGTSTAQPAPPVNLFGSASQQSVPAKELFGKANAEPANPNNLFGSRQQSPAPVPVPTSNLFGSRQQSPAPVPTPTSNLFGSTSQQPVPATSNLFGTSSQPVADSNSQDQTQATDTGSIFSRLNKSAATPASQEEKQAPSIGSIFSGLNAPATTSNLFSSPKPQPPPSNNLFGQSDQSTAAKDPFSTLNKPVDDSVKQPKTNGLNSESSSKVNTSSIFTPSKVSNGIFGQSKVSDNTNTEDNSISNNAIAKPPVSFGSSSAFSQPSTTNNIFSSSKTASAPAIPNQATPSGLFSRIPEPSQSAQKALVPHSMSSPAKMLQRVPDPSDLPLIPDVFNITDEQIAPYLPAGLDEYGRKHQGVQFRLKSLNQAMGEMFSTVDDFTDPSGAFRRYIDARKQIIDDWNAYQNKNKGSLPNGNTPSKLPRQNALSASIQSNQSPVKRRLVEDEDQENQSPGKKTKENPIGATNPFQTQGQVSASAQSPFQPQFQAPTRADLGLGSSSASVGTPSKPLQSIDPPSMFNGFSAGTPSKPLAGTSSPVKPISAFGQIGSPAPPTPSPSKGKRKAEEQITKDMQEGSPLRQIKTPRLNGSSAGSDTSNIFKNILDTPTKAGSPTKFSPEKKLAPLPEPKDDSPRTNPFGSLPVPASPTKLNAPLSPAPVARNAFTPKHPSSLSNVFTPASASPPSAPASAEPARVNLFAPQPAVASPAPGSPFSFKPTPSTSNNTSNTIKPPVFGSSSADGLSQFAKKAAEDKKKAEEKRENDAFDNDYDSEDDGDPEEWRKKYRAARKIELEELEALAKKSGQSFTFKPQANGTSSSSVFSSNFPTTSQGNTDLKAIFGTKTASKPFGTSSTSESLKAAADIVQPSTEPKSFFGSIAAPEGPTTSAHSSANPSRTSTPGLLGSSSGSVLDGTASSKPVTSFANIFGKLSDSGSAKADDADDDSADEENDADEENKDPSYKPTDGSASGPGTPVTPAEETGAGIASAVKANPFSGFGAPKASFSGFGTTKAGSLLGATPGTSTPGGNAFTFGGKITSSSSTPTGGLFGRVGKQPEPVVATEQSETSTAPKSLFDRIETDASGKPVKMFSTEEKENAQPIAANPFGSIFSKTPGAPADKTWKPDSPIKFLGGGSTGDGQSAAPKVSVTAATPTKPPFSNLFGSKDATTAVPASPFSSSIFANSSNAKPPASSSVGFSFGGPSAASSLLPSNAASTTTSRATTPGATTDGDSGADANDPDAEKHEQINLTAGGPGEEDEEVLLEVRAKALKFESGWITKGVGPLRVLKHKQTNATRILHRADPSGSVLLNKGLLAEVTYKQEKKTVTISVLADAGGALETYLLQVKTEESAKNLAEALESNKKIVS